jgi:RNA polymerase sigma-70 factor (ECF subfamily)
LFDKHPRESHNRNSFLLPQEIPHDTSSFIRASRREVGLVNGFDQPNTAAWETEELFSECRDSLIRYLRYHLDDLSEAEDIAQESFIRFFHARHRNEPIVQPRAWLFRVAHNLLIDQGRKKRPELLDEDGWARVENRFFSGTGALEAQAQLSRLPWQRLTPMEMGCLRLRAEGLKFREIGEVLNLSISTVVSYISRGISKLRPVVAKNVETPQHGRTPAAL